MGLYIKGMEMPKCCRECDAEGHYDNSYGDEYGFFCPFGYKAYTSETRELKRLDNCPLIPVPPHGRLGDLDELYASLEKWLIQNRHSMTEATRVWIRGVLEGIAAAPTIIPAEEGET